MPIFPKGGKCIFNYTYFFTNNDNKVDTKFVLAIFYDYGKYSYIHASYYKFF